MDGECVPLQSSELIARKKNGKRQESEVRVFDTKLCRKIDEFIDGNPVLRSAFDEDPNDRLAAVFAEHAGYVISTHRTETKSFCPMPIPRTATCHNTPHRAIGRRTPLEQWALASASVRYPDATMDLDDLLLFEAERRVQKDRTVSLHGRLFEVDPPLIGAAAYNAIRTEISRLAIEAKQLPVLVVDEAHHLRNDVLEDLRLLTNFAMDFENRMGLILVVGLTELRRRLTMAVHESLSQRLVVRHHLTGLEPDEVDAYLTHRLRLAGYELPLF